MASKMRVLARAENVDLRFIYPFAAVSSLHEGAGAGLAAMFGMAPYSLRGALGDIIAPVVWLSPDMPSKMHEDVGSALEKFKELVIPLSSTITRRALSEKGFKSLDNIRESLEKMEEGGLAARRKTIKESFGALVAAANAQTEKLNLMRTSCVEIEMRIASQIKELEEPLNNSIVRRSAQSWTVNSETVAFIRALVADPVGTLSRERGLELAMGVLGESHREHFSRVAGLMKDRAELEAGSRVLATSLSESLTKLASLKEEWARMAQELKEAEKYDISGSKLRSDKDEMKAIGTMVGTINRVLREQTKNNGMRVNLGSAVGTLYGGVANYLIDYQLMVPKPLHRIDDGGFSHWDDVRAFDVVFGMHNGDATIGLQLVC